MLRIYERGSQAYDDMLKALSRRGDEDLERVEPDVRAILAEVRAHGDAAIFSLTHRFESRQQTVVKLDDATWRAEAKTAPAEVRDALAQAAERIRAYHEHQRDPGYAFTDALGIELGQ